ncbi:hypothetical protein GWK47_030779 [Chionoecetes opilio]|uniref:Uncharacterized protein n=1 Tax=Chionoecetes opilio TaxID=41210 RepID=A0A8J4YLE8_CHIOP|nr:hypothetical protein GWK47_030779 [Chionoecetes opilio]
MHASLQALLAVHLPTSPSRHHRAAETSGEGQRVMRLLPPLHVGRQAIEDTAPLNPPHRRRPSIPSCWLTEANRGGTTCPPSPVGTSPQGHQRDTKPPTSGRTRSLSSGYRGGLGVWCLAAAKGRNIYSVCTKELVNQRGNKHKPEITVLWPSERNLI